MCQREDERRFTRLSRPRLLVLAGWLARRLRNNGTGWMVRRALRFVRMSVPVHTRSRPAVTTGCAAPGFPMTPAAGRSEAARESVPPYAGARMHEPQAKPRTASETGGSPARAFDEVLGLQPGEWVQVKSEAQILATLDASGRHRGLAFLPEMSRYCGRRFRVFKRIERIFLEESKQIRTLRNTVLLEGAHCGGAGFGCDKACFLYWREAWLTRCEPGGLNSS